MPPDRLAEAVCSQVAHLLKAEREQRGLSLNVVAQRAGLSWHAVKLVETGLRNPTLDTLVRLCLALELDPGQLVGRAHRLAQAQQPTTRSRASAR